MINVLTVYVEAVHERYTKFWTQADPYPKLRIPYFPLPQIRYTKFWTEQSE